MALLLIPDPSGGAMAGKGSGVQVPEEGGHTGPRAPRDGAPLGAHMGQAAAPAQHSPAAAPQSSRLFLPSLHPTSTTAEPQTTPFRAKLSTSPSPPSAEL